METAAPETQKLKEPLQESEKRMIFDWSPERRQKGNG